MKEFFTVIRGAMESPDVISRNVYIRNLIESRKQELPVIEDVYRGKRSFEKIIEPIVQQNLQIRFLDFFKKHLFKKNHWKKAEEVGGTLEGILSIRNCSVRSQKAIDITAPLEIPIGRSLLLFSIPILTGLAIFMAVRFFGEIPGTILYPKTLFGISFFFGSFLFLTSLSLNVLAYLKRRHIEAEAARENARYLDWVLQEACRN